MDFPIVDLMDRTACEKWIQRYFHPDGSKCPHCEAPTEKGLWFRRTERSDLDVYRCRNCKGIYNLYSGTIFEGRYFTPEQTVLFIREVCQGKQTAKLARELGISRTTATEVRRLLLANAEREQETSLLDDLEVETDEMFQNAGGKKRLAWRPGRPTSTTS
jgi:transposase-like protein